MKKLTANQKKWLILRAANQYRRETRKTLPTTHIVRLWSGSEVVEAVADKLPRPAPTKLCFDQNAGETIRFLQLLRRRLIAGGVGRKSSWTSAPDAQHQRHIGSYTDFSQIEYISTAAALVLAAEYERIAKIMKSTPPAVNLDEWNEYVFARLFQLGFFPLLGLVDGEIPEPVVSDADVMTLRFWSGSDAGETEQADKMLVELGKFIDPKQELSESISIPLTSALSEAMVNVRMHAYPSDYRFQYRHVNRWWLTGSADRRTRKLTVAIFDQGASIPVTYQKRTLLQGVSDAIWDRFPGKEHPFRNDAAQIDAAVRYGSSQTDLPQHGKGLPQMRNAIDACGKGRLMIFSRGGRYVYHGSGASEQQAFSSSIGGTLIEWTIELPERADD